MQRSLLLITSLGLTAYATEAWACGGFFCSQTPVLQTAERIVFEIDGDVVTAYVQLQYQGNDPNFAWVVPVPEVPEVEVGVGQQMFEVLEAQTRPVFVGANQGVPAAEAPLQADVGCGGFGGGFGAPKPGMSLRYIPVPDVEVWQNERVGPYDVVTLTAEDAVDLNNWLRANGYQVVPGSDPIVQDYLDAGMKLLALKLAPMEGATAIEPIKMTYHDSRGCASIPVKLTAIAAVPGLEIVTWVFGESRAAPRNYEGFTFDNVALERGAQYEEQLAEQVDAKGGQAFVTEYASITEEIGSEGDATLQALLDKHGYVTRMRTELDPDEMTVDPEFDTDFEGDDVPREVTLAADPIRMQTGTFVLLTLAVMFWMRRKS